MPKRITLTADGRILLEGQQPGRAEFSARLVRAGRIRTASGDPGPFIVSPEAIKSAVTAGMFNSLAVFLDHPGFFENASVKALVGITHSAYWNEATQSADAIIRLYVRNGEQPGAAQPAAATIAEILEMIMEDAAQGIAPPNIGVSLVFWPVWSEGAGSAQSELLTVTEFKRIDSADIVFSPAADGRILQRLSTLNIIPGGNQMEPEQNTEPIPAATPPGSSTAIMAGASAPAPTHPPDPANAGAADAARNHIESWMRAARQAAIPGILSQSGLPQVARDRLARMTFDSPQELERAIQAERDYLASLAENQIIQLPGGHPRGAGARISQMLTGLDHARNAVDYLFGVPDAPVPEPMLRRSDTLYVMLTGDQDWHGVFHPERVMLTGADTATLANLAANAMNKVVIAQLALLTFYRWYEHIAVPTANDGSLQDMSWISFGGITTLPTVPEKGSYGELDVDDVKEADSFIKYGGYVGITREMLRRSEIQRIQAVPRALAAASVKTRSYKISYIFTQSSGVGPTLDQDSTALFHSNHSNVATTALGTDLTAWRAAALECFKHTEVSSGDRIGVFPKFLLVPPDLYFQALANFGYGEGFPTTYLPEALDRGIDADPRPVPLAVPHFTDATDWAYITDPKVWPVIHMSFSADPSGRTFPPPEIFAVTSETAGLMFTNDTLPVKVRDEFAYGVNGYRGIGKRNVA